MNRIGEPDDQAYAYARARICLASGFFQRTMDDEDRARIIMEYVKPLAGLPRWAVEHAWDKWMATETRQPKPADIAIEANAAVARIRAELAWRDRIEAERLEDLEAERRRAERLAPELADQIVRDAGIEGAARRFPAVGAGE